MVLLDILRKYIAPGVLGAIAIDNYRRQVYNHKLEILKIEIEKEK